MVRSVSTIPHALKSGMGLAQSKHDCAPCYFSKPCGEYENEKHALDGNRLVAELTTKPRDDDYLGQSQAILDNRKSSEGSPRAFLSTNPSDYVPTDKAGDALTGETVGGLRDGYVCPSL